MGKITAAITGIGHYLPEYLLTNEELSTMVDTSDEWIMSRIGIKTRHILKGEALGTSYMGALAVKELIEKSGIDPMEVGLVICATITPDMLFPSTANLIADQAGCKNAFAYDISAACSGFLFALATATKFIETGSAKKVIVVGADKMSSIVDYTDRNTCPIFGDGAAAVLLEASEEGFGVIDHELHSDGSGAQHLYMKAGGSRYPASEETLRNNWHTITQDGQAVFKAAVSNMADVAVSVMDRNNLKSEDITYLVPHQANLRIIDATARRMGIEAEKCMINIDTCGNTTAATIPLCLHDYESKLKVGDNLILASFGGGYTWGAIYVKWAYDGSKFAK
ncbi:MAG: beta-ketoacyl-ACP synthase III [Rikenellaceae bacterium]